MQFSKKVVSVFGNGKISRFLAMLLAICIFIQLPFFTLEVNASTQSEIDNLKQDLSDAKAKKSDLEAELEAFETQQATSLAKKELLDEKMSITQKQLEATEELISQYAVLISEKKANIKELEKEEEAQLELYKQRVRAMEEEGSLSYISILFSATSFSDLLSRFDMIKEIMEYDEHVHDELVKARKATQDAKLELEDAKAEEEEKKLELELLQNDLNSQLDELSNLIKSLESNISEYEKLVDEADKEADDIQNAINEKIAENTKKQQQNTATPSYSGNGTYIWPTASKYITSPYGNRLHPILGYYRYHSGVDIGGGGGNPIWAAAAGTVIISTYEDGYGNYVVVDHGGSTTLYAHMSSRNVSVGQYVNQGDVLGWVGTTGLSTGYHLHFEISINGSRIDPLTQYSSDQWIRSY